MAWDLARRSNVATAHRLPLAIAASRQDALNASVRARWPAFSARAGSVVAAYRHDADRTRRLQGRLICHDMHAFCDLLVADDVAAPDDELTRFGARELGSKARLTALRIVLSWSAEGQIVRVSADLDHDSRVTRDPCHSGRHLSRTLSLLDDTESAIYRSASAAETAAAGPCEVEPEVQVSPPNVSRDPMRGFRALRVHRSRASAPPSSNASTGALVEPRSHNTFRNVLRDRHATFERDAADSRDRHRAIECRFPWPRHPTCWRATT